MKFWTTRKSHSRRSGFERYTYQHLTAESRTLNSQNSRSYDVLSTRPPRRSADGVMAVVMETMVVEAAVLKEMVAVDEVVVDGDEV